MQSGDWSQCKMPYYLSVKNELCTIGKLVMRGTRIVIPQSLGSEVLRLAHEGHQGIMKMKTQLRTKVWWPKIDSDAEKVCRSCPGCQVVGEFRPPEPMQRVEPPSGPWQDVAIDVLGPFPSGENLLVVVDYYSRFFEVVVIRTTTSQKIIEAYRTTPHSSTGATPAFLMFGRELKTKLPELRPNKSVLDEGIRDRDWNQKLAGKMYADKQRYAVDNPIAPGHKVLVKNSKSSGKLTPNFETEPYTVQTKEGQELSLKSAEGVVQRRNSSFVKPYNTPEKPENPGRAEALTSPVISPLPVVASETTEPRRRPN